MAYLQKVSFGAAVTAVGHSVFEDCWSLTDVDAWHGNGDYSNGTLLSVGKQTFKNCTSLSSISFPDTVVSFNSNSFYNCCNLTSLQLPSCMDAVGSNTFKQCSSLTGLTFPASLTAIGKRSFEECTSLKLLAFKGKSTPEVKHLANYNWGLSAGTRISCELDKTVLVYEDGSKEELDITGDLEQGMIDGYSDLVELRLGFGVQRICSYAITNCIKLKEIYIGSETTVIEDYAVNNCPSLYRIEIDAPSSPEQLSISSKAFALAASSLQSLVFSSKTLPEVR